MASSKSVVPGVPSPQSAALAWERQLRKQVLNPYFRRIQARVRAAQRDYEAIRAAIAAIPQDPALAGLSQAAAASHMAKLRRYHTQRFTKRMNAAFGISIKPYLSNATIQPFVDAGIANSVALIQTVPQKLLGQLTADLQDLHRTAAFDQQRLNKLLRERYGSAGYNLRRLTRDQTNKAIGNFNQARQQEVGIERYVWSTALDERVRHTHAENEGVVFRWDSPPATGHPGFEIQCFPGSVRINPAGLQGSIAYRYVGEVIEIRLADGVHVTTTPNHPVLTEAGWKNAGAIDEEDQLLKQCGGDGFTLQGLNPQLDDGYPFAEQLHCLLGGRTDEGRTQVRRVDLHGNPMRGDEDIDVVAAPRVLRDELETVSRQLFGDLALESTDVPLASLPALSGASPDFILPTGSTDFLVSSASERASLVGAKLRHSDEIGFMPGTDRQVQVVQAGQDHTATDAKVDGHLFYRLLGAVAGLDGRVIAAPAFEVARVASVRRLWHDGLVYSFETATGLIVANGIVTHNCRCIANAIIPKRIKGPGHKGALNWPTPGGAQQVPVGAQGLTPEQLAFYDKRRKEIFAELKAQAEAQGKVFSVQYSSKLARAQALKEAKAYGVVVPAPVPVAAKPDTPIAAQLAEFTAEQQAFYNKRRQEIFAQLKAEAEAAGTKFSVQYAQKKARAQAFVEAKQLHAGPTGTTSAPPVAEPKPPLPPAPEPTPVNWNPALFEEQFTYWPEASQKFYFSGDKHAALAGFRQTGSLSSGSRAYTGTGFRLVNGPLRSGRPMANGGQRIFDDLMADMRPLEEDHIVYRGYRSMRKQYKVGDAIKEKGFVSTSKDPNTSTSGHFFRQNGVLVQIRVRKGQNAIITNSSEREIILPPGQQLTIRGVRTFHKDGEFHTMYLADLEPLKNVTSRTARPRVQKVPSGEEWIDSSGFKQIGGQKGSNPGALYEDATGQKWYIKQAKSEEHAWNELLASKLYQKANVLVADVRLTYMNGRVATASKWIDELETVSANTLSIHANQSPGFVIDAWLANWDVVGANYDNLVMANISGVKRLVRLDVGGALRYRAQGGLKGVNFGDTVGELDSLRNAQVNRTAANVFGDISQEALQSGAKRLGGISPTDIADIVNRYGPKNVADRAELIRKLTARREDILRRLAPWSV